MQTLRGGKQLSMSVTNTYKSSDKVNSVVFKSSTSHGFNGDILVIPFYKSSDKDEKLGIAFLKESIPSGLSETIKTALADLFDENVFKADVASKQLIRLGSSTDLKYIAVVGLGPNPKKGEGNDLEIASALRLGKALAAYCKEINAVNAGVVLPTGTNNAGVTQLILGFHDALYTDNRYKKAPEDGFKPLKTSTVTLLGASEKVTSDITVTSALTTMISDGVSFARDLVNAPPNSKTPLVIADLAKKMATEHKLKCTVLGEKECKERGMGAYLGVQQGSMFPPQFIHLVYRPDGADSSIPKVALIGKGLTFDSGGYNLKAGRERFRQYALIFLLTLCVDRSWFHD